jgi:inactivated superfamily I helicase/RecB family exonuclease
MPRLYTVPAGESVARHAARYTLNNTPAEALSRTILLLPNRRSCAIMRQAFQKELAGKASLLPRLIPLADIDHALVNLLGESVLEALQRIPPAMPEAQQRYALTQQIMAFAQRDMAHVTLDYGLTLADTLMALQEQCCRAEIAFTQERLHPLMRADFATHWSDALQFLSILTDTWPKIERAFGMILAPAREVALLNLLTQTWRASPPAEHVIAVGSTGSQPATARLLTTIADLPHGHVILPGLDPNMPADEWAQVEAGHPLFHIKSLLDAWPVTPAAVTSLVQGAPRSLWLDALAPATHIPAWGKRPLPPHHAVRLIACAHPEEEARVIALLLRESIENPSAQVALITPDEGLMARVASHMQRYDILVDRIHSGCVADTETGSLWVALVAAITDPSRILPLRSLLQHPLLAVDRALLRGLEKGWHGVNRKQAGQLPRHDAGLAEHPDYGALKNFVKAIAQLSDQQHHIGGWISACEALLAPWVKATGQGHDAVAAQLETLRHAEHLGAIDAEDFSALLQQSLSAAWRDAGLNTHPRIFMLTPVEARLQQFDRVILANMQESLWPGTPAPNPWLNMAAQKALGLPSPEQTVSRVAHDVLMLASSGDVFLTYPKRDQGTPTTRSRFIERLVTLLRSHAIDPSDIEATQYVEWANARDASDVYEPEPAVRPTPPAAMRPRRLPVSDIEKLFTDPFSIYARHVLGLRKLEDIDAALEARDFGTLAHKAIESLTQHWNHEQRAATDDEIARMAQEALKAFSERPNVDLFWRLRLTHGLRYVNGLEAQRRPELARVEPETTVEEALALDDGSSFTLHGRIDRIEMGPKGATIIDYKTGKAPSEKEILDGRALQLIAYSMLLHRPESPTLALEYWELPKLGEEGILRHVAANHPKLVEVERKLRAALAQMLDEETPFLARPVETSADERFGNDYEGISRYDEWAG